MDTIIVTYYGFHYTHTQSLENSSSSEYYYMSFIFTQFEGNVFYNSII